MITNFNTNNNKKYHNNKFSRHLRRAKKMSDNDKENVDTGMTHNGERNNHM